MNPQDLEIESKKKKRNSYSQFLVCLQSNRVYDPKKKRTAFRHKLYN